IADTHGVDMGIHHDDGFRGADAAQDIAHTVDADFIEAGLLHLLADALNDGALVGAFAGDGDQVAEKTNDVRLVGVGGGGNFRSFHETTFPAPLWGRLSICGPSATRPARRLPIAAQDAILPHSRSLHALIIG